MHQRTTPLSRRRFTQLAGITAALAAAPATLAAASPARAATGDGGTGAGKAAAGGIRPTSTPPDAVAATFHQVLLRHTRWTETQWDATAGHYTATDFGFAVVLGHALLLTRGGYDASVAGIDEDTLRSRTLATLTHFAASNRLTGGTEWGKTLFFDTTFQLYFVLAARLLWDELDTATQGNIDSIVREQAAYTTSLGSGNDPLSAGWTPDGLLGNHVGDTKLEEMGVYAQSLAPALAWASDDTRYPTWNSWYGTWSRNETGLPAADLANPTVVDGVPVSGNTAQNLYDTFIVENHGSFGPHYQCELWRTSGRNTAHFLTSGRPMPEVLAAQPNADRLWASTLSVMSDAGEPLMPMVNDREHLYGRDVIPVAFLAQVLGDRAAARAETALAERLPAYQAYAPADRITKFSGEPKYEPEARAELAISYLLHEWRAAQHEKVTALTAEELFHQASGVTDFGTGPGLVSHQTPRAWAASVTKPGFVKFCWQPAHDDWLFSLSGSTPMFLPATTGKVATRTVATHTTLRDGLDASAVLLALDSGYAGFTTLPGGEVVYATSGTGAGEGRIEVFNLTMPGVPGLDGSRTYTTADGSVTVAAADTGNAGHPTSGPRTDNLTFTPGTYRYLRMQGRRGNPQYGYSVYAFEVRDGASGADLAQGRTATASSADSGKGAALAVDGNATTRWAVSVAERTRADSWLQVDLGAPAEVDRVTLSWETAAGQAYTVQGSTDGSSWTDLVAYPPADLSGDGGWISVDGRAGLIVRGAANPLAVYGDTVILSDGPAERLLVEGLPDGSPAAVRAAAARPAPTTDHDAVRASTAGGHLSLFNLSGAAVTAQVALPQDTHAVTLYAGSQTVTADGTAYQAELGAATAALAPARAVLRAAGGRLPQGLSAEVRDAATVVLSGPSCRVEVAAPGGRTVRVTLRAGRTRTVTLPGAAPYPLDDLALGRVTFPTSPLPPGMSDPAAAVDGDPHTAWTPGPGGRMVVDLGAAVPLATVTASWTGGRGPAARVETSTDGLTYQQAGTLAARTTASLAVRATARYVALALPDGAPRGARLVSLAVTGAS
ncbi:F5/8 type C domain-containing protein [Actinacidiphila yanglinensis]|uniref:F5/8 type C domain-containing protein n=1 Tax=Actinacidiphila yanglinensis TaxID=310779 RepID=A0A1H5SHJ4_9ACTN|nr:discoidin domain-containing protein [Actinacidiphila yanglinensis]SEF50092.1 F5/8 type C domain-containing protein [Actinacidiphila yanglinensis]